MNVIAPKETQPTSAKPIFIRVDELAVLDNLDEGVLKGDYMDRFASEIRIEDLEVLDCLDEDVPMIGTLRAGGARVLWKSSLTHTHTLHSRTRAGLSTPRRR